MYENQNVFLTIPAITHTMVVWISRVNPIARGWFIWRNSMVDIIVNRVMADIVISRGSLIKILILGINDKEVLFSWSFKRMILNFGLQDQCFG
jgi:hypothetical protein